MAHAPLNGPAMTHIRRVRRPNDSIEAHAPEYLDLLRALELSAHDVIHALRADETDAELLAQIVTRYVACAVRAEISRARIREALELLVHTNGGSRWFGLATAIASLARRGEAPRRVDDQSGQDRRIA